MFIISIAIAIATFVLLLVVHTLIPRLRRPRLRVCYPGGKESLSIRHSDTREVALHIEHKGGIFGIDGESTGGISMFGYFPSGFSIIEGRHMARTNSVVASGPHAGRFKGYNYVVVSGFFLIPKEVEEVFFKIKTPSHTGKYKVIFVVASQEKAYTTKELEVVIT